MSLIARISWLPEFFLWVPWVPKSVEYPSLLSGRTPECSHSVYRMPKCPNAECPNGTKFWIFFFRLNSSVRNAALTHFMPLISFDTLLISFDTPWYPLDVFRGYQKRSVVWNGLTEWFQCQNCYKNRSEKKNNAYIFK